MRKLTVTVYIVTAQSPGHFHYTTSLNPDEAIEIQHAWKEKGWYALSISSEKHELEIDDIPMWKLLEAEEEL